MTGRPPELQHFIDSVEEAVFSGGLPDAAKPAARNIFDALAERVGRHDPVSRNRPPVCEFLPNAFENARAGPGHAARLGEALAAIEAQLAWNPKQAGDAEFRDRHANATVIGVDGIEQRDDVRIGVSVVAPDTVYPDHHHPPEEIYAVLSDSAWRQEGGPWRRPGLGGTVHNTPNILHAMRAYDMPLLAVWSLWTVA